MARGYPNPATPQQIQMYGHIKVILGKLGLSAPELNAAIGLERGNSQGYKWLTGKGAPGPKWRAKVAKLAGVSETDLMSRRPGEPPPRTALVVAPPDAPLKQLTQVRTTDPLTFRVTPAGETHIRLDVTLPADKGVPLLRMLLDAGIVFGPVAAD